MLRPLLVSESVALVFEPPEGIPPLRTDEAKVSQILRNFISNALKFTERGEVRVSARLEEDGKNVLFSVADTGIGIHPKDHQEIFKEFSQIENPLQRRVKGTGLGLPLTKKLAGLLGGSVGVRSEPGSGSTFWASIPRMYVPPSGTVSQPKASEIDPARLPVLVVEDSFETVFIYEKYLNGSGFQLLHARTVKDAKEMLEELRPSAIVLDIMLRGEDGWAFLAAMKRDPLRKDIPIIVLTSVDDERKAIALGADSFCRKPVDRERLLDQIRRASGQAAPWKVLVIDDNEVSRYLVRQAFMAGGNLVLEAGGGDEGIRKALQESPQVIFLDLLMPGISGEEVLERLHSNDGTRSIPVVIFTSKDLSDEESRALAARGATVLSKGHASMMELVGAARSAIDKGQAERKAIA
jgi:CheY-like chemotaxis protein